MIAPSLSGIRGLLIDLDGVLYRGAEPVAGAAWFLEEARARQMPFLLVTNNSTTRPAQVASRLERMGIAVTASEVLTSGEAGAAYIRGAQPDGSPQVLVVGEEGLREEAQAQGLSVVDSDNAEWVLAGLDRAFNYQKLSLAVGALLKGARFVATNSDALLPLEGGVMAPGAGCMVAAIAAGSGQEPVVVGKPEQALFLRGLERLGHLEANEVAMIGDRLDTDIEGSQKAGLRSILVLTGVTTVTLLGQSEIRPEATAPDIASVGPLLGWGSPPTA